METKDGIRTDMVYTLSDQGVTLGLVAFSKEQKSKMVEVYIKLKGEDTSLSFRISYLALRDFIKSANKIHHLG